MMFPADGCELLERHDLFGAFVQVVDLESGRGGAAFAGAMVDRGASVLVAFERGGAELRPSGPASGADGALPGGVDVAPAALLGWRVAADGSDLLVAVGAVDVRADEPAAAPEQWAVAR
jgi:hypothetical protein